VRTRLSSPPQTSWASQVAAAVDKARIMYWRGRGGVAAPVACAAAAPKRVGPFPWSAVAARLRRRATRWPRHASPARPRSCARQAGKWWACDRRPRGRRQRSRGWWLFRPCERRMGRIWRVPALVNFYRRWRDVLIFCVDLSRASCLRCHRWTCLFNTLCDWHRETLPCGLTSIA
jgi:hypothetical protein